MDCNFGVHRKCAIYKSKLLLKCIFLSFFLGTNAVARCLRTAAKLGLVFCSPRLSIPPADNSRDRAPETQKGGKISPAASSWWGYRVGKP